MSLIEYSLAPIVLTLIVFMSSMRKKLSFIREELEKHSYALTKLTEEIESRWVKNLDSRAAKASTREKENEQYDSSNENELRKILQKIEGLQRNMSSNSQISMFSQSLLKIHEKLEALELEVAQTSNDVPKKSRIHVTPQNDNLEVTQGTQVTDSLPSELNLNSELKNLEFTLVRRAMNQANGNKAMAAQLLGINRTTLVEKLKRMDA